MNLRHNNIDWRSMSDPAIAKEIGEILKQMRLNRNLSQSKLEEISGVSRITISRIERGQAANFLTIIQILRAFDKLSILNAFQEDARISPLQLLKMKKKQRQRASGPRKPK